MYSPTSPTTPPQPGLSRGATHGLVVLCLTALAAAQGPGDNPRVDPAGKACELRQVDATYQATGASYCARFLPDGPEFAPVLGTDAPRLCTFHFSLASAERAGARLVPRGTSASLRTERLAVHYQWGPALVESYAILPGGIEQYFTISHLPVEPGDLVLRVRVDTNVVAPVEPGADGSLCFAADFPGGIRYGAASAQDATGRAIRVSSQWTGKEIELRLPAAELEGVALPLVIDPLIGSNITVDGAGTGFEPKVAYLAGANRYLVTWLRAVGGGVTILVGQLLNTSGGTVGGVITIESGTSAFAAIGAWSAAAVRQSGRFLVAYSLSGVTWGRAIDANTGVVSPANGLISTYQGADPIFLGGDSQLGPAREFACLAWSTAGGFGGAATYYTLVQVPPAGSGLGPTTGSSQLLNSGSFFLGYPSVSRDCGPGGRWLIAYATNSGLEGAVVSQSGQLLANHASLATPFAGGTGGQACAGDGTRFMIAFNVFEPGGSSNVDLFARVGTWSSGNLSLAPAVPVATTYGSDEFRPAICMAKYKALVTWVETAGAGYQLALNGLDPATGVVCDTKATYATTTIAPVLCLASEQEGGDATSDRALAVWASDTYNILARRMESVGTGGTVAQLTPGCGNGGTIGVNGPAAIANSDFAFTLSGAQGILGLLNWNSPSTPVALGSCLVTPLASPLVATITGGAAIMPLPIPANPALLNLALDAQWIVVGSPSSPVPFLPNYSASNRIRVTVGP